MGWAKHCSLHPILQILTLDQELTCAGCGRQQQQEGGDSRKGAIFTNIVLSLSSPNKINSLVSTKAW